MKVNRCQSSSDVFEAALQRGMDQLRREDPDLYAVLLAEHMRQLETLSLVASSGGTHLSVLAAHASVSVNVTAEGYPRRRYHAGCKFVDEIEQLAIDRARRVFGARYANVQPHCASSANQIVMHALLRPGDVILGMALESGGHLTHGARPNISGRLYTSCQYGTDASGAIDFDQVRDLARANRPRLIICGTTAYSRTIPFERFRAIADEVGAYLLADITHIAGLVAAGLHPSPVDHAHFTTLCTFKQLFGPRSGLILMGRDHDRVGPDGKRTLAEHIQSAVFPLLQGAPKPSEIAAKAHAFARLEEPGFRRLAERIVADARALATALARRGYRVVNGGTDNHIVVVDLGERMSGLVAEEALEACDIIVNKNKVPGDRRSATMGSGIRLGTNTVALRGLGPEEMDDCAELMDGVLSAVQVASDTVFDLPAPVRTRQRAAVHQLCATFPMPYEIAPPLRLLQGTA